MTGGAGSTTSRVWSPAATRAGRSRSTPGPTPQQRAAMTAARTEADALAGRTCVAAALAAQAECELIELVGEFDARGAIRCWNDLRSVAHWLGWACSMTPGVAREHVRVARALPRMPTVREAFREGRLSYSKVREVTRVVDAVDEARLCELALSATASQLARMISAYRTASGTRLRQQERREASWTTREDGLVDFRVRLPAEEAATLIAAITAAKDQLGAPPEAPGQAPAYGTADALLDVARSFLASAPEDRSGEDRRLVVVHVAAEHLVGTVEDVPAGTSEPGPELEPEGGIEDVPAGTSPPAPGAGDPVCHVEGVGPIEAETARRLSCDAPLLGAVVDAHGSVLALGRTRRLVSRAQRRALMIRDRGMCTFPGCHQTRHLEAHHRISWADGGLTDLDNLLLLCRWHHTCVHEGGMTVHRRPGPGLGWVFLMPDGTAKQPWYTHEQLPALLDSALDRRRPRHADTIDDVRASTTRAPHHPTTRYWCVRPARLRRGAVRHQHAGGPGRRSVTVAPLAPGLRAPGGWLVRKGVRLMRRNQPEEERDGEVGGDRVGARGRHGPGEALLRARPLRLEVGKEDAGAMERGGRRQPDHRAQRAGRGPRRTPTAGPVITFNPEGGIDAEVERLQE